MKLSLIIPVYNESRRIERGLKHATNYLQSQKYSWEIIVVDDGSIDNTAKLASTYPVNLLRTHKNFGKGHAIRVGVASAEGELIFFSDIDFSVSLDQIPAFITALKNSDVAIGSRRLTASNIAKHQPTIRESLGRGFTALSNLVLGLHHSDLTCGFKGFSHQSAKKIFSLQKINGWAFDSEILYIAHKLGIQVKEISVTWKNDPLTKVNVIKDMVSSLLSLLAIKLNDYRRKYS